MKKLLFITLCTFGLNVNAQNTAIPDVNFETKLIALGYDSGPIDHLVLTTNISAITVLDINNSAIQDLTGIQDFVSLTLLDCVSNQLTTLNVSNNNALIQLACGNNQLTSLNLPNSNTIFKTLQCENNRLVSLNVSNNNGLTTLSCKNNSLISLNISSNSAITLLSCQDNMLTTLDISSNVLLKGFDCSNNKLTTLSCTANTALTSLYCSGNQLTSLNVKNQTNTNLVVFQIRFTNNPNLTCIEVDDTNYSNLRWQSAKDASASYSNNCPNLKSKDYAIDKSVKTYPNPTQDFLNVSAKSNIETIELHDLQGRLMLTKSLDEQTLSINITNQPKGIYLLKIKTENGVKIEKIIKN